MSKQYQGSIPWNPRARLFALAIASTAQTVQVDNAGRMLIPQALRHSSDWKKDCIYSAQVLGSKSGMGTVGVKHIPKPPISGINSRIQLLSPHPHLTRKTCDFVVYQHQTVLKEATTSLVGIHQNGIYLDGTLGGGGHTEAILQATNGQVVGIDRDPAAIQAARRTSSTIWKSILRHQGCLRGHAIHHPTVGPFPWHYSRLGRVISPQLDQPDRGFSFQHDGPLDMRMDPDQDKCIHLAQSSGPIGTVRVLHEYGEEPRGDALRKRSLLVDHGIEPLRSHSVSPKQAAITTVGRIRQPNFSGHSNRRQRRTGATGRRSRTGP